MLCFNSRVLVIAFQYLKTNEMTRKSRFSHMALEGLTDIGTGLGELGTLLTTYTGSSRGDAKGKERELSVGSVGYVSV